MHSKYSPDSFNEPKDILKIAKKRGLNGIAITDHRSTKGSLAAKKLNKDPDFEVIPASELMTDVGEVLAYYIQEDIPKLPLDEALDAIKDQGGLASIAHPFSRGLFRKAFNYDVSKIAKRIHALEGWNGRMITPWTNHWAQRVAKKNDLAVTGGSDAHFLTEIGRGYAVFEEGFEKALKTRKTRVGGVVRNALFYRIATLKPMIQKKWFI